MKKNKKKARFKRFLNKEISSVNHLNKALMAFFSCYWVLLIYVLKMSKNVLEFEIVQERTKMSKMARYDQNG